MCLFADRAARLVGDDTEGNVAEQPVTRPRAWALGRLRFGPQRPAGPTVFAASCAAPMHGAANAIESIGKDGSVVAAEESGLSQVLTHLNEAASALRSATAAGGGAASAGLLVTVARRPALQQETPNNIGACTTRGEHPAVA